jgi:cytochrome c oxidase subunit 2
MQSALDPAGREAQQILQLFTWMTWGAILIALGVILFAWWAQRARSGNRRAERLLIVIGGVLFPVAVLLTLMIGGLWKLPRMLAPAEDDRLSIEIVGSQWWWRVRYVRLGQPPVELANEIRLPVGRRVNTRLIGADVIHSFWVPSIAGKLDMIPGRINRLALEPTRTGVFRGACAEFCGTSHGLMNFIVVVMEPDAFSQWLTRQAEPAVAPSDSLAERGRAAFHEHGCMTCHTIRGGDAFGTDGPDLTHVGSRRTLAAGILSTRAEDFERWISSTELLKPGAHMPAFARLPRETLTALAAYLTELQ